MTRARQTAHILFPQAEQIVVPGLREMDFGTFEGRNYIEMENDPDYRAWVDSNCESSAAGPARYSPNWWTTPLRPGGNSWSFWPTAVPRCR